MTFARTDYYEILQVSPNAEQEVIAAAYRRLASKYHPDVNKDASAAERMRLLNEAFEILGHPDTRAEFDAWLFDQEQTREPQPEDYRKPEAQDQGVSAIPSKKQRSSLFAPIGVAVFVAAVVLIGIVMSRPREQGNGILDSGVVSTDLMGPQASIPTVDQGENYAGPVETFELNLGPGEELPVEFPLAIQMMGEVSCAGGTKHFTWSVRKPYPVAGATVEFFNEIQGTHQSYGTTPIGEGVSGICHPVVAVNRSDEPVLVEIRYVVGIQK